MTDYSDLPQTQVIYAEQERTIQAVANIDGGATLTSFVIGQTPPPTGLQPMSPTGGLLNTPSMAVTITLDAPASDQLMSDLRAWLVQRSNNLNTQLTDLGVTNPPTPPGPPPSRRAEIS